MKKKLAPAERLIVAADFKPTSEDDPGPYSASHILGRWRRDFVRKKVLELADSLKRTGVYLKVNSALRVCGYDLIGEIHSRGLQVFADLRLFDIGKTLSTEGVLLSETRPELVSIVCTSGLTDVQAFKDELPGTEVLGVTVPLNFKASAMNFGRLAEIAGVDGLICAPTDISVIKAITIRKMTFNTLDICPTWAIVPGDDQNPEQIMTPAKAVKAGADRIIVDSPIVNAKKPYDAVMRTIDEITSAMA